MQSQYFAVFPISWAKKVDSPGSFSPVKPTALSFTLYSSSKVTLLTFSCFSKLTATKSCIHHVKIILKTALKYNYFIYYFSTIISSKNHLEKSHKHLVEGLKEICKTALSTVAQQIRKRDCEIWTGVRGDRGQPRVYLFTSCPPYLWHRISPWLETCQEG